MDTHVKPVHGSPTRERVVPLVERFPQDEETNGRRGRAYLVEGPVYGVVGVTQGPH